MSTVFLEWLTASVVFALRCVGEESNGSYRKGWRKKKNKKRWCSLDRRSETQINCFNSKSLGNGSKSSNIVRLWMTWNAAATWIYRLLLLEDSTQTHKMEPGLHNTYTTLQSYLMVGVGAGIQTSHLSKYNNKLYQAQTAHTKRHSYCLK